MVDVLDSLNTSHACVTLLGRSLLHATRDASVLVRRLEPVRRRAVHQTEKNLYA
jgi:hypothetical protein